MTATLEDVTWWCGVADSLDWHRAKTYEDTAPHAYIVKDRDLPAKEFDTAVRAIRSYGQPGKFWQTMRIYLVIGANRYWTNKGSVEIQGVINRAPAGVVYGDQAGVPVTQVPHGSYTAAATYFDSIATIYDESAPKAAAFEEVRRRIISYFGAYGPITLDVGCGTGRLFDLGVAPPSICTVLDPSQGMLNELVLKYPRLKREQVLPRTVEEYLAKMHPVDGAFEMVTALGGSAGYLHPRDIRGLYRLASKLLILMFDVEPPPATLAPQFRSALDEARALPGARWFENDEYVTVVVERG
jgi:hypothetical protein